MLSALAPLVRATATLKKRAGQPGRMTRRIHHAETSFGDRGQIDQVYGGTQGALLAVASALSGHLGAAERILRDRQFDLRGLRSLLDVGSGAGQIAAPLLRYADPATEIICSDFSTAMLQRARTRLEGHRPRFVVADMSHLPFADNSFDGITCGYVLEHLPQPEPGLQELARVLMPGGRLLLMTMEDNFFGKLTSHTWHCRTHNRDELRRACEAVGLEWWQEIQVSRWHQMPWIGGICVELRRPIARQRPLRHSRWNARDLHIPGDKSWRP